MKNLVQFFTLAIASVLGISQSMVAQSDMFWSIHDLNDGAVNGGLSVEADIGETFSAFLYWGPVNSVVDTGMLMTFISSAPNTAKIIGGETFDFDINLIVDENPPIPLGVRWGQNFGPGNVENDGETIYLSAFTVASGDGIRDFNTGPVLFDAGYDPAADAFLIARVDFEVLTAGEAEILLQSDYNIANDGFSLDVSVASFTIHSNPVVELGDVNRDGVISLLDIEPFIDLLINNRFQIEADMNQNGAVDLLDVEPFIAAVESGSG
ncbi:MAG: dockerin type I domain-containing protein [Planctomycetota bacterium]